MLQTLFSFVFLLLSQSAFAAEPVLASIEGKTIIPVEIRTPYITCDRESLVNSVTDPEAPAQFIVGKYRKFIKNNLNNGELEHGLNFVMGGTSKCVPTSANAFSFLKADMAANTINVAYLAVSAKNLGQASDRYKDIVDIGRRSPDNSMAQEASGLASMYQLFCPWTTLKGISTPVALTTLDCQLVNRPPTTASTVTSDVLEFFGWKNKPVIPGDLKTTDTLAAYLWQADFSLNMGRGLVSTGETVKIQSYLVCKDKSGENAMAFAVMEKAMTGMQYMCR